MPRTPLALMDCPIARALDVVGDRWTPLILRDVAVGITRFDALQASLGISRKVLSERLAALVEQGVLQRTAYQQAPVRHDYLLTDKGADLGLVLLALRQWGNRWTAGDDDRLPELVHVPCGAAVEAVACCAGCGEELRPGDVAIAGAPVATAP